MSKSVEVLSRKKETKRGIFFETESDHRSRPARLRVARTCARCELESDATAGSFLR
jgi:hypothetical protein